MHYFCGDKTEYDQKLIQYEEISITWSFGRHDDDQLLNLENRGPELRHQRGDCRRASLDHQ